MRKLMVHFAIPKEEVEVGTFEGAEASAAGSLAGVSDSDEINTLSALIANSQQLELARQNELAAAQEGPGGIALQGGVALPAGVALKGGVALGERRGRARGGAASQRRVARLLWADGDCYVACTPDGLLIHPIMRSLILIIISICAIRE